MYKDDGLGGTPIAGILDHDNSEVEFFTIFGDCDDQAYYSKKKLKELGYKPIRYIMCPKLFSKNYHFDCLFKIDGKYALFNYGSLIHGNTLKECFENLQSLWKGKTGKYYSR